MDLNLKCSDCQAEYPGVGKFAYWAKFGNPRYVLCDECFARIRPLYAIGLKACRICKERHPRMDYGPFGDYRCEKCRTADQAKAMDRLMASVAKCWIPNDMKVCTSCKQMKRLDDFAIAQSFAKGRHSSCKECEREKYKKYGQLRKTRTVQERALRDATVPSRKCYRCGDKKPPAQFVSAKCCASCAANIQLEREESISRRLRDGDSHVRRSALLQTLSDGTLDAQALSHLFGQAKDCPYCGVHMNSSRSNSEPKAKTLDHLQPISKGGAHSLSNVIVCCRSCNSRKQDIGMLPFLAAVLYVAKRSTVESTFQN